MIITDSRVSSILLVGCVCLFVWSLALLYHKSLQPVRSWRCLIDVKPIGAAESEEKARILLLRSVRNSIRSLSLDDVCECRGFLLQGSPGFPESSAVQLWIAAPDKSQAAAIASSVVVDAVKQKSTHYAIVPRLYSANHIDEYVV